MAVASSGASKAETIARLRASGQGRLADLLGAVDFVPGEGIDFGKVAHVLLIVLTIYIAASVCGLMQGRITTTLVQRSVWNAGSRSMVALTCCGSLSKNQRPATIA